MPCFNPLHASRLRGGDVVLGTRTDAVGFLMLPCGHCIGCFKERSRAWAIRIMHEAKMHERNCFITLTYDDEHLPMYGSLRYEDFQNFMKRLRKKFSVFDVELMAYVPRFFMCGEYGEKLSRPHYHACLFGIDFTDKEIIRGGKSPLHSSASLSALWPFGFASVGSLSFASARYVAAYCTKKFYGSGADEHYQRVIPETGEVVNVLPEFGHCSLKPGIGAFWYEKFARDVFPHDRVVINGSQAPPPRYYLKKLKCSDSVLYDEIKRKREQATHEHNFYVESHPSRLNARNFFEHEMSKSFKRNLK